MKKKVVVIDGQGGKIGRLIIEQIKVQELYCDIYAIGTNSVATANMLKAGADYGATGENPVIVNCKDADILVGPIGIVIADSLMGEVTLGIAAAAGRCAGAKILLPINRCGNNIVGIKDIPISEFVNLAVENISDIIHGLA